MQTSAICYLLSGGTVMLARPRQGLYAGFYTGYVGKISINESVLDGLVCEIYEESRIRVDKHDLKYVALVHTYRADIPTFLLHVFTCDRWEGVPENTEEMHGARLFKYDELPLTQMLPGDQQWLPLVLQGNTFQAQIRTDSSGRLLESVTFNPYTPKQFANAHA